MQAIARYTLHSLALGFRLERVCHLFVEAPLQLRRLPALKSSVKGHCWPCLFSALSSLHKKVASWQRPKYQMVG